MLKYYLLASAISLSVFTTAQAAVVPNGETVTLAAIGDTIPYQVADRGRGSDGGGGHDNSGSGHDDDDNGADDDDNDDDDNGTSGSGRKKPRVPGGSGCDDAGDMEEHPECRT